MLLQLRLTTMLFINAKFFNRGSPWPSSTSRRMFRGICLILTYFWGWVPLLQQCGTIYIFNILYEFFCLSLYIYIYINIVIFLTQFEGGLCTSCFKIGFLHAIAATALPCLNFFPHVLSNICFVIFLYDPLFSQSFFSFLSRSHYLLCLLRENVSESDVV